jgi:hypothetical protein
MTSNEDIPRVAIEPADCLRKGLGLIKDQYWLFVAICFVVLLIINAVPLVLQGPLYCGLAMCFIARERGERIGFERVFKGFDVFVESLVATLVFFCIALAVCVPFMIAMIASFIGGGVAMDERNEGLGAVLFTVGGLTAFAFMFVCLALNVYFAFAYTLIVDRKLGAMDAVRTSARAGRRNFWGLMGLMLLNALIGIVAVAACYLPVFLFLPISFASFFVAYRKVFPAQLSEEGGDDDSPDVEVLTPEVVA